MLRPIVALALSQTVLLAGCGAEQHLGPSDPGLADASAETGTMDPAGECGLVIELPPLIAVVNAATGSPVCDPTFTIVGGPPTAALTPDGGNAGILCTSQIETYSGCTVADASSACVYALESIIVDQPGGAYTIEVSKAGFASAIVSSVWAGAEFCDGTGSTGSHLVVSLSPIEDSGAGDASGE